MLHLLIALVEVPIFSRKDQFIDKRDREPLRQKLHLARKFEFFLSKSRKRMETGTVERNGEVEHGFILPCALGRINLQNRSMPFAGRASCLFSRLRPFVWPPKHHGKFPPGANGPS